MFKKALLVFLSFSFVISSIFSEWGGSLLSPLSVCAEEKTTLEEGTYSVPLFKTIPTRKKLVTNTAQHFYGNGLIKVDSDGNQTITIGVENWSLYDAFIPRKQEYVTEATTLFPSKILNESNYSYLTNSEWYLSTYPSRVSDAVNDWFDYGDVKFGNITVEVDNSLDVAYVTFNIDDYQENLIVYTWVKDSVLANKSSVGSYQSPIIWYLDTQNIQKVDSMSKTTEDINWNCTPRLSTVRGGVNDNLSLRYMTYFSTDSVAKYVFDNVLVQYKDGKYVAKYHINQSYNGIVYSDFKTPVEVKHGIKGIDETEEWDLLSTATFETLDIIDECIELVYDSIEELWMGKYVFFKSTEDETKELYCMPYLLEKPVETFTIKNEETGIYIETDTSVLPKTTKIKVLKNSDKSMLTNSNYVDGWKSTAYLDPNWYTVSLVDENDNEIAAYNTSNNLKLYIPLPEDFNSSNYYTEIRSKNGDLRFSQGYTVSDVQKYDLESHIWQTSLTNGNTYAIMQINDNKKNIREIDKKGIYSATAILTKSSSTSTLSMANDALCEDVKIIVDDNGKKKMYFKAQTMEAVGSKWYLGGICCNDTLEDSISYTKFAVDETGKLLNNAGYDAVTEIPCIEGGILTLSDGCYQEEENAYLLGVVSAAMARMGDTAYEDITGNELQVLLQFTSLEKCDDSVTLDKVLNEYGYGYQPSALLRKIKQTEIKYNIGKNNSSDSTAFTEAYKVYSDPDAKSQDIEAAIKALDAVTTDVAPSAVIKGHDLTVNQWYELSYYVDLGYDVQSDKNAKVVFTLADGRTKTFDITDDLFVAGQGYRFTLELAAKQMADKIHAKVVFSDGTEKDFSDEYSVKEFLNDYISTGEDENLKAFAQATLNYGAYAQKFFDYNTEDLAAELADFSDVSAEQITDPASSIPKNVGDEIEFAGAALTLEGETSIKLYFELTGEFRDPDDHTIKYNGKKLEMQASNVSDVWYVTIPGIKAKQLGNVFKFTVDGTEYEYSPYTYMNKVLTNWEDTKYPYLHDLLKALYAYSTAANKC